MARMMSKIGVVYLYRFAEGEMPVRRFLTSYRKFFAGADHDLHIIFKGFPDRDQLARARALFDGLRINIIEMEDIAFDVGSYVHAARTVANPDLLFLNTFSEILSSDWLRHFDRAHRAEWVGLVGATGSWLSNAAAYEAALRRAWIAARTYTTRRWWRYDCTIKVSNDAAIGRGGRPLRRYLFAPADYIYKLYEYGRYPNPHIRTNAFMMNRELFLSLEFPSFKGKQSLYRFESGRRSLTRQIIARGLEPVVIDRNGAFYKRNEWKTSSTFWIGNQTNLLIADNRTNDYAMAEPALREYLEDAAWAPPWSWRKPAAFGTEEL